MLNDLLTSNKGCVSTTALRRELENHGIADAQPVLVELKFFDPESSRERGIPVPNFKFHHLGRSFYSEERYKQELKKQEEATTKEADAASRQVSVTPPEEPTVSRTNRQEEARLVAYVKSALEDLYSSEAIPEDRTIVFDCGGPLG